MKCLRETVCWTLLVGTLAPACGGSPPELGLVIETNYEVPNQIDEIRVTATASSTPAGNVCEPVARSFPLDGAGNLPIRVTATMGSLYTSWAAFRIDARLGSIVVARREIRTPWPATGTREIRVLLDGSCPTCSLGQECIGGSCADLSFSAAFDDPGLRDTGVWCDAAATPEDAGDAASGG